MNVFEAFHYRPPAIHRLALVPLIALSACATPATPTRVRYPTPAVSPTPSFMGGTRDLNCEELWEIITPKKDNSAKSVFPGGHSQWWVGKFKDGQPFLFASGIYGVNKNDIEFVYRCSPFEAAQKLYKELKVR